MSYIPYASLSDMQAWASGIMMRDPDFGRLRDDRHRSGRKTLAQRAKSGDLEVKRQATWGMSAETFGTQLA